MELDLLHLLASALRLSIPLWFAAFGGLLCERSGVVNIALEGFLLVGAFTAAAVTIVTGDPYLGLMGAILSGAVIASLFGFLSVTAKADHIVSGVAINFFVLGSLPLISKISFGVSGSTPSIALLDRLPVWVFFATAVLLGPLLWLFLQKTRFGLRLRASGENVQATKSLGISVSRMRFSAVVLSGMVTAVGGAFLSISHGSQFSRGMSAGRGYIALAALILARWKPIPVLLTCFVFGLADAAQILLQSYPLSNGETLPVQWIQMFPYLITVLVLVGIVGKTEAPKAIGKN